MIQSRKLLLYLLLIFINTTTFAIPLLSDETPDSRKSQEYKIRNILESSTKFKNLPPLKEYPSATEKSLKQGEIPQYVIDYAPLVHLYSEERYLPYDIADFVTHFHAEWYNETKIPVGSGKKGSLKITDLDELAKYDKDPENRVFMTSNEDFDKDPEWLTGLANYPNFYNGEIKNAPATLIVVDKGNGWIDAYWFYFYSFNLGPFVMGFGPYGDHVGDWEHSLVRFYQGEPVIVWMSAHGGGGAYFYNNLEKSDDERGLHPIIFSARGTHANYASVGQHSHDIPYAILSDFTDRGPLWNPTLNYLAYTFDGNKIHYANGSHPFRESKYGDWLNFLGKWGDKKIPPNDPRQHWSPWEWKYIDGPSGPLAKNLLRISPCQRAKWWNFWNGCNIRQYIQYGNGFFDKEGNNGCGGIYNPVKPGILKLILELLTRGGWLCWLLDLLNG